MRWLTEGLGDGIAAAAFLIVAGLILASMARERRLGRDALGLATAGVFAGVAVCHATDLVAVTNGSAPVHSIVVLDLLAAVFAGWYGLSRGRRGRAAAAATATAGRNRRQAQEINDDIVQGLALASMALELGELERSRLALEETMTAARQLFGLRPGEAAALSGEPRGGDHTEWPGGLRLA